MVEKNQSQWYAFDGLNVDYLLNQYEVYLTNEEQVDPTLVPIFEVWEGIEQTNESFSDLSTNLENASPASNLSFAKQIVKAIEFIRNIRDKGHLQADVFPLQKRGPMPLFELNNYGLSEEDLAQISVEAISLSEEDSETTVKEFIQHLKDVYMQDVGFDIAHLPYEEQKWFRERIENNYISRTIHQIDRNELIDEVFRAEGLEQYLQKYYMGQKRFSGEGIETLIPVMNEIVDLAGNDDFNEVYVSMAHRGRLNALVHVLDQTYEWLLAKFEGVPYDTGVVSEYDKYNSTGDVKYHLGAKTTREYNEHKVNITMANNPSHLEYVNSVMQGMARAAQDSHDTIGYSIQDPDKAIPILVHGDAAVVGQGVNYETLNFSNIHAYHTGGSIHIIANNTIGFTTDNDEGFATEYPSDAFKGAGVPVLHLNADCPESAIAATKLAYEYRQTFHKDIFINLIGYRRLGHNELDEPRLTNPKMYSLIDNLGTISEVYGQYLVDNNLKTEQDLKKVKEDTTASLDEARKKVKESAEQATAPKSLGELIERKTVELPEVETKISRDRLERLNQEIMYPDTFNIHRNLKRVLDRRLNIFEDNLAIDWSLGEALAYASILEDSVPIRFSGEDSERGTFSHRNMVMKDSETGESYIPLHHLTNANVSFDLYNSPLSEMAVAGFEYGYSMTATDTLVFWEAQYGDFANGAQVIFDQFVSGGRKKWGELSGLVLLIPHGYEGAGPEHSSGRVERFLQLSAENNWTVANLTTSAQLFHILRRQASALGTNTIRPLVIMTPKSLLRSDDASSAIEEFTEGKFHSIITDERSRKEKEEVERLILTSGRLSVDVASALDDSQDKAKIAHIRVEELYPFPEEPLKDEMESYKNLKEIIWVQEEPQNMGAYSYMALHLIPILPKGIKLDYIGRPAMAAPSEGLPAVHKAEQKRIVDDVLNL